MSSSENWQVIVSESASRNIKRVPTRDLNRIQKAIDEMESNPFAGDIDKLGGEENAWRRRIGNYRIIFEVFQEKRIIYIYEIKRRTSRTY